MKYKGIQAELSKEYDWTRKDQKSVDKIYVKTSSYFRWFMIGLLAGIAITIFLNKIGVWALFKGFGGIV